MTTNTTRCKKKSGIQDLTLSSATTESRLSQAKQRLASLTHPHDQEQPELDLDFEYRDVIEFEEVEVAANKRNQSGERQMTVFEYAATESEAHPSGRDADTEKRLSKLMSRLRTSGLTRPLPCPVSDWKHRLHDLIDSAPSFEKLLLSIIWPELELTSRAMSQRMPPILLVGPPGCGKSFIAKKIAALMNSPTLFIDLGAETNGSSLAGSSTFYSNSSPGLLFQALAWGCNGQPATGSPVVILDEVDKACGKSLQYDPIAPLYGLLEEDSAAKYVDQSLPDIQINASRVRYILTANSVEGIPEPILSRVIKFDLEPPTLEQSMRIARNILSSIVDKLGVGFNLDMPSAVLECAGRESPRRCKTRLQIAVAYCVAANINHIDMNSWRLSDIGRKKQKSGMGFMS